MDLTALIRRLLASSAVVCVMMPRTVSAYLDPGTGSYILQLLLAVLLGGLFSLKLYWYRIKESIKGLFSRKRQHGKK